MSAFLFAAPGHAQGIAVDSTSTVVGGGAQSSLSWSHTVAGSDRLLVIGFSGRNAGAKVVSSVTFNGVALTQLQQMDTAGVAWMEMWYLVNPPLGTYTVSISFSKSQAVVAAISFTGVNQSTPFNTPNAASGSSTTASVTVASAVGELVLDTLMADNLGGVTSTVGGGQTSYWNVANNARGNGSTAAGASSVTMSWALSPSRAWAQGAVSIKPVIPTAPASLTATAMSSSQIDLAWTDNSSNEAGFKIERKTGAGGSYAQIATVGANVTAYSDTGLASGTTYYYQVRAYNAGGDSAYSNAANATTAASVASFNVVEPAANAVTGKIYTKIAGVNFAVDVVALDAGNAIATTFTGAVAVEAVDASSGGACSGLPLIASLTNQTFVAGDSGRHALSSPNTVANVYRNARIRIKYPTLSPTVTACSGDNFAIRPNALSFAVQDASRTTAGTTNTLNNTVLATATPIHNAGRPLRIAATAYNGAGAPALTSNYDGTPTAVLSVCGGTACTGTLGTLTLGSFSASGGTVTTTTASYNDVGAFNLQLQDATWAAVDAADGTSAAQLTISSAAAGVGRFVPDRFLVSATSITPRSDSASCSASSFTYMGERMNAAFTLTAVAYPSGTTTRYTGSLARLALATPSSFGFGAIDSGGPTVLGARLNTSLGSSGSWSNGVAAVTAIVSLNRNAAPDGPYNSFKLGIAPSDPDTVVLDPVALNLDADNNASNERAQVGATTGVRFGVLRLLPAYGSELVDLPVLAEAQYWDGLRLVTNAADQCTAFAAANVAMGNYQRNLAACETAPAAATATLVSGRAYLKLARPGNGNSGSVDLTLQLGSSASGQTCSAVGAAATAASAANLPWLQGRWGGAAAFDQNPATRASFGQYRSPLISQRELY